MTDVETLKKAAYDAMNAYQEAEAIERDKHNKTLIGRCFKYHNSGGGCDEKWWLYLKVTHAVDGHLRVFKFEKLPNGNISIEPDQFSYSGKLDSEHSGYQEIGPAEYDAAWSLIGETVRAYSRC